MGYVICGNYFEKYIDVFSTKFDRRLNIYFNSIPGFCDNIHEDLFIIQK
jgi:hypothetical protein